MPKAEKFSWHSNWSMWGLVFRQSLRTGVEIGFVLKFGHGLPVPLGHMGAAQLGVVALLDLNGVIKPFPESPVLGLILRGRGHFEFLHGYNGLLAGPVDQGLSVRSEERRVGKECM